MTHLRFQQAMAKLPLVAILRGVRPDEVDGIADVLVSAGIRLIEVPLTSPDPFDSIARLARRFGDDVIIGGGTVRRVEQIDRLIDAGGRLMVTPHADTALIAAAARAGLATLPGVATPTEAFAALDAGADGLKLFPSSSIPPATVAAFRTVARGHRALVPDRRRAAGGFRELLCCRRFRFRPWWRTLSTGRRPRRCRAQSAILCRQLARAS